MTRKRVKFGLALLGLLLAFLMGLLALMFVPTLASADKGPGGSAWEEGHGKSGDPAYLGQTNPDHSGTDESGHPGSNPPHGDAGPCADAANPCEVADNQGDGPRHYYEGPNSGGQNSGGQGGNGNPGGNTDSGNDPHGGQPGPFAGWLPSGGGFPGGGGIDEPNTCTKDDSNKSDKDTDSDKDTGKKTCDKSDDGSQQSGTSENLPGDPSDDPKGNGPTGDSSGDFSSGFFGAAPNDDPNNPGGDDLPDPNCFPFGDFCGSQNDDPPNTSLTDPPNEIPEPFTLSLFAVGLTGAAALRRTRRKTIGRPLAG